MTPIIGAQPQFGEMISLVTPMKLRKKNGKKNYLTEKKPPRVHYRSDSATENCLIILLIKCEPEKNSFFSPRAQLG